MITTKHHHEGGHHDASHLFLPKDTRQRMKEKKRGGIGFLQKRSLVSLSAGALNRKDKKKLSPLLTFRLSLGQGQEEENSLDSLSCLSC